VLGARTVREVGKATRNPVPVAAADQFRNSLRGPVGAVLDVGRQRPADRDVPTPLPTRRAPRTPFNHPITANRKFAFRTTDLTQVKDIKNALGASVNDIVMAACAGALRAYLEEHGALPEESLVAMVPVSTRTGTEEHRCTNRVSGLLAVLPTDEPDPIERVRKAHAAMDVAKGMYDALPAETLTELSEFPPPGRVRPAPCASPPA
jgi:GGDEF domain-containing protein